ncbi:hypothetical protein ACJMK2_033068 [Sinanodonta woodiana]|uniref:Poly [ADP-ribose] polymerase n=1 Tax=Sinanodonta woodiana TaxID=1069815 RepID=A0ABD3X3N9_SINWO
MQADAMIWGIDRSLDVTKGRSSKALVNAAGDMLQAEIKKKYPGGLTSGNIAVVNAGNLNCKEIYFISLEKWNDQVTQQNVLWNIIWECLSIADKSKFVSIITPAIGSGFLGYPAALVAKSMFECINEFSLKHPDTTLKIITIAVYTGDKETYNIYTARARSIACPGSEAIKTHVQGSVSVKIYAGSLADWRADVLVCSCSPDLDLSKGGLANCLLQKAGSQLQDECNLKYPHGIQKGQVAVANGYNLHCKKVYFGSLSPWSGDGSNCKQELAIFVCECLKLAHIYKMQSVAFPALGTGSLKYPPQVTASVIHACVEDFCKQNPSSNLLTYIVVNRSYSDGVAVKQMFEVTGSALSDIIQLVNDTLKKQPSPDCNNIKVKEVQRLENLQLFDKYASFRHAQFPAVSKTGKLIPLEDIQASTKGQPLTLKYTKRGCVLDQDIYPEVNEHYLFHGTSADAVNGILKQGLDNRLASNGRFGNGIYCAETPAKSNQYTDQAGERKMFLVRAYLGEIYIHNGITYQFKRAPCKTCQKDRCSCGKPLYDSIVAEGALPYREFILHDRYQVYPEYLITYTCS